MITMVCFLPSNSWYAHAQHSDVVEVQQQLVQVSDSSGYDKAQIIFPEQMRVFFAKLGQLDTLKQGKVNIVHIGDSHIQADFFPNVVREKLQERFGNAGLGFVFPYRLAKTNGNAWVRYNSNVDWESYRNIYPVKQAKVGLSGIGLQTNDQNAVIELKVTDIRYGFSRVKLFTPENDAKYKIGTTSNPIVIGKAVNKSTTHLIKSGQSLSTIARTYHTSVNELKRLNNLKSSNIVAGKKLIVPSSEKQAPTLPLDKLIAAQGDRFQGYYQYELDKQTQQIFFYTDTQTSLYELNGLVLLNDNPGVVYHTIGVNGARFSDYTKYDLFFEQLTGLEPDLLIVSMGTNESFDRMEGDQFIRQVNLFLEKVRNQLPDVAVLITTPSPSYFSKSSPNTKVSELSDALFVNAMSQGYALWDMYHSLGGILALPDLREQQILAKDLVHYTVKGYQYTGELLYQAIIQSYQGYNKNQDVQSITVSNDAI